MGVFLPRSHSLFLKWKLSQTMKKQLSDAKCKELSGNDIFGPAPEIVVRPVSAACTYESKYMGEPAPRNVCTSVKVSNKAGRTIRIQNTLNLKGVLLCFLCPFLSS
ncbi:hypothetical protein MKX01_017291 [Papaver californicum]|nr:hypothetical protein MKX01_017291 [Papaver californicum]